MRCIILRVQSLQKCLALIASYIRLPLVLRGSLQFKETDKCSFVEAESHGSRIVANAFECRIRGRAGEVGPLPCNTITYDNSLSLFSKLLSSQND